MATIPVENVAEVEIRQMIFGQLIENTLYFLLNDGWSPELLSDLATSVGVWFIEEVLPSLSAEISVREVLARDLSTGASAQGIYSPPANAGASGANAAPSNVAIAISLRTALAGRSFRGRNFIAGISNANTIENQVDTATADIIVAAYNLMMGTYVSAAVPGVSWGVVSRFADGAARVAGVFTPIVLASLTDYFIDSQRKRLTGRGQ